MKHSPKISDSERRERHNKAMRKYYAVNKAKKARYYQVNKTARSAYDKMYRALNDAAIKIIQKEYNATKRNKS